MDKIRKRIYEMVEVANEGDQLSDWYDAFMLFFIILSIAPMLFKGSRPLFEITDCIAAIVFIVDYALRWMTADYKLGEKGTVIICKVSIYSDGSY